MRYSQAFIPTLKETPADAEVVSHQLMLRAGLIRQLAPGIYSVLPLGLRVLRKIERIVREELEAAGGQEVELPVVQPAELWMESGRWEKMGPELLRFRDRRERSYCLAATAEEVITDLVRREVQSYRQLPLHLYQIRVKFRDEIRPRFGVMRAREFTMEDSYTFDADEAGLERSYQRLFQAYSNIFRRCGLEFRAVEADVGAIGGSASHEFMVLADSGEDAIATCTACPYAANVEKAEIGPPPPAAAPPGPVAPPEKVPTPGIRTVEEVSRALAVPPSQVLKTLLYEGDGRVFAVVVRGDHQVNEIKLRNALGLSAVTPVAEERAPALAGAGVGSIGPVGLALETVADAWIATVRDGVTGAGEEGYHLRHVVPGRDFQPGRTLDIRVAVDGDPCPRCGGRLAIRRGIEVGHVFKLGTRYSAAMRCTFLDADGVEKPVIMGTYGIGIGRTMAAAIEQNHDKDGIIWPVPIAPYQVIVLPLNMQDPAQVREAEALYAALGQAGWEVLLDDRDERPGAKFKDADLIGIPLRLVVSDKTLRQGAAELKVRRSGEVRLVPLEAVPAEVARLLGPPPGAPARGPS
ncbi:MAG TPA: proline--tRNA ligase [Thermodesulfobacteriota bacterium]|nr:proline--tRNA ligase [Thermodesulfobacteriota bacterium]